MNNRLENSFILKQENTSVLCLYNDDITEELMRSIYSILKCKECMKVIWKEYEIQLECMIWSENGNSLMRNNKKNSVIDGYMKMSSIDNWVAKIRLENMDVSIYEYLSCYYKCQELDEQFFLFPIENNTIKLLQKVVPIKYTSNINSILNKVEGAINEVVSTTLPTKFGLYTMKIFQNHLTGEYQIALVHGEVKMIDGLIPVRIHSECLTGDAFHSLKCDCGEQLNRAFEIISDAGVGVIVYLRQEGRGIGLLNKARAYELQDNGLDTVDANLQLGFPEDLRDYSFAYEILRILEVTQINLLTNNPLKLKGLDKTVFKKVCRKRLEINSNPNNQKYLNTKKMRMNHMIGE